MFNQDYPENNNILEILLKTYLIQLITHDQTQAVFHLKYFYWKTIKTSN